MGDARSDRLIFAASVVAFVLFWLGLAWAKGDPRILPGPLQVLGSLLAEVQSGAMARHVGATLARVVSWPSRWPWRLAPRLGCCWGGGAG